MDESDGSTYGRRICGKTIINTGRDCELAEWIIIDFDVLGLVDKNSGSLSVLWVLLFLIFNYLMYMLFQLQILILS